MTERTRKEMDCAAHILEGINRFGWPSVILYLSHLAYLEAEDSERKPDLPGVADYNQPDICWITTADSLDSVAINLPSNCNTGEYKEEDI